jgi:hypothetical protein
MARIPEKMLFASSIRPAADPHSVYRPPHGVIEMEPNEQTTGTTGETVEITGDYVALCCRPVVEFKKGDVLPVCPSCGKPATWQWIAPTDALPSFAR